MLTATVCRRLEQLIQEKTGNPDERLINFFDFCSGVSSGGLLVGLLNTPADEDDAEKGPRYSAAQVVDILDKSTDEMWNRSKKMSCFGLRMLCGSGTAYKARGLENILHGIFGNIMYDKFLKPC